MHRIGRQGLIVNGEAQVPSIAADIIGATPAPLREVDGVFDTLVPARLAPA